MVTAVSLSKPGTHFELRCPHCLQLRSELVNPALNKIPFSYQPNCAGCGQTLDPDLEFVAAVQTSFSRATFRLKKTTQSREAMGGIKGGDKATGSPAYSALQRRADSEKVQTSARIADAITTKLAG